MSVKKLITIFIYYIFEIQVRGKLSEKDKFERLVSKILLMVKLVRRVNWHRIKTSFTLYQLPYRVKIFPNQLFILDLQILIFLNGYFVFFQRRLRSISWTFRRFYFSDVLHFHKRSNEEDFESEEKAENGLVLPTFEL